MSSHPPTQPPHGESGPVSDATLELARGIEDELLRTISRPASGSEDTSAALETQRQNYPHLLFGQLAMHLADIQLPSGASEADRSRAVIESLRRIVTSPRLLEAITHAPNSQEIASLFGTDVLDGFVVEKPKNEQALALQRKVSECGYLERPMVESGIIQLQYATTEPLKVKTFGKERIPAGTPIRMKLIPATLHWDIQRYRTWHSEDGYAGRVDDRQVSYDDVFMLLAIETDARLHRQLDKLLKEKVGIGRVATGVQLKLAYHYGHYTQELEGYEKKRTSWDFTLPAKLVQVYAGDTSEYPLFRNF